MKPDVVVDIGNTRIKWGLCAREGQTLRRMVSLADDPASWEAELAGWRQGGLLPARALTWVLASVQPARCARLRAWLEARGDRVEQLTRAAQLPLHIALEHPDRAGIDRLLNGVAASRVLPPGRGAVLVGAGTAVTLDWLDEEHVFRGGAIFPGLDLMAESLHRHTALLPRVAIELPVPSLPAGATIPAVQAGIFLAVTGGIREAVRLYGEQALTPPRVFLTGGQAPLLGTAMGLAEDWVLWPEQTLMGIVYSAEALP